MTHIVRGKAVKQIAAALAISVRTVRFHLANARRKLGSASLAQAAAAFVRE